MPRIPWPPATVGKRSVCPAWRASCTAQYAARAAGFLVVLVLVTGCPSPSIYGTPETTPSGGIRHTVAAELVHARGTPPPTFYTVGDSPEVFTEVHREEAVTGPALIYQLRAGLSDTLDFGLRVGTALGVDVKWRFVSTRAIDAAIDPGVQAFCVCGIEELAIVAHLHLPFLIGVRLSSDATLLTSLGAAYSFVHGSVQYGALSGAAEAAPLARMGVGVSVRTSETEVQPELTAMRSFGEREALFVTLGVGFTFGASSRREERTSVELPDDASPRSSPSARRTP